MNSMRIYSSLVCVLLGSFLFASPLAADKCQGKIDIAPAYIHIDVLEHEKTVKRMDMGGVKADASIIVWKGLCFKPTVLLGTGSGNIATGGCGVGFVLPVTDWLCFVPSGGCNWTHLSTTIKSMTVNPIPVPLANAHEKFNSISPYASIEAIFKIGCSWRICAQFQYAWSHTHTTIKSNTLKELNALGLLPISVIRSKSDANGPSYALMVEYDVTDCWSVNLGGAYNISLTKEKFGLRGAGCKLGLAYWF